MNLRTFAKGNKTITEEQIIHDSIYLRNLTNIVRLRETDIRMLVAKGW